MASGVGPHRIQARGMCVMDESGLSSNGLRFAGSGRVGLAWKAMEREAS